METDPESISWLRVILAFTVVFGLMAALGFALKYINMRGINLPGAVARGTGRLQLVESLMLDVRRRLVIVRCDDKEHLLLLGQNQDIVVESRLHKNPKDKDAA